jgi:hypothetical protein
MHDAQIAAIRSLYPELRDVIDALPDALLRARPAPGEWSALEICGHLRDVVEVEGGRISRLLAEDDPQLAGYDERELVADRSCTDVDPAALVDELRTAWERMAERLEALPEDAWLRPGRHSVRGAVTVSSRVARMAEHTREHFAQIARTRASLAGSPGSA